MASNYRKRIILVTGGCGFIGTNLVKYLFNRGYKVRILDNLSTSSRIWATDRRQSKLPPVTLITGDIRDMEVVEKAVMGVDAVVHLAAYTSVVDSLGNPDEVFDINVNGTFNLLEACHHHGVKNFIFASSNAAVGEQAPPIDETKVPQPFSPYGASKLAGEVLCSTYHHSFGLRSVSLRFANCYGPYSEHTSIVATAFIKWARERKPLIIYGDGNQTRDFVHVDDVCYAIYLSLTTLDSELSTQDSQRVIPDSDGRLFQIGSGIETSINQLAGMITAVTGNNLQTIHEPERKGEIKRNYSDISKAKALLGFEPKVKLEEGLRHLWEWFKEANR